jgi:hypothetical protein
MKAAEHAPMSDKPNMILMMRPAEKPTDPSDPNLTKQGKARQAPSRISRKSSASRTSSDPPPHRASLRDLLPLSERTKVSID